MPGGNLTGSDVSNKRTLELAPPGNSITTYCDKPETIGVETDTVTTPVPPLGSIEMPVPGMICDTPDTLPPAPFSAHTDVLLFI